MSNPSGARPAYKPGGGAAARPRPTGLGWSFAAVPRQKSVSILRLGTLQRRRMISRGSDASRPAGQRFHRRRTGRPDWYNRGKLEFRHIAIEGPIGVGKSALAARLGARLDAKVVLDDTDNPFLADFAADRPGAAFQTQLFSLLARHRQQVGLRQTSLFSQRTVSDYLFDKDKIYAYLNLDDNELFIYQRLYDLLVSDVVPPDLAIYLQVPTDALQRRVRSREREYREDGQTPPDPEYLRELNEAYTHFFFHYGSTPLLVVEAAHLDLEWGDAALGDLLKQVHGMGQGTRYYVPR